MQVPPLAEYRDDILGFVRDLTTIKLTEPEEKALLEFQWGARKALGLCAWKDDGLMRVFWLTYILIAWKTLCFENQLTGIYGKNLKAAWPWLNGFRIFIANSDDRLKVFQFSGQPRATMKGDDFWRIVVFNPNESEFESAKRWLTNVIYYDFNKIPEWLIRETQRSVKRPFVERPVSLAIFRETKTCVKPG